MGLGGAETTEDGARAASLCALLPRGARTRAAENPDEEYGLAEQLLIQCEYDLRSIVYAICARKGDPKPEPIRLPSEREHVEEVARQAAEMREEVDAILGLADASGEGEDG